MTIHFDVDAIFAGEQMYDKNEQLTLRQMINVLEAFIASKGNIKLSLYNPEQHIYEKVTISNLEYDECCNDPTEVRLVISSMVKPKPDNFRLEI